MKIRRDQVEDILGLSPIQTGILYEYLLSKDKELYVAQISLHLVGTIDIGKLKTACQIAAGQNEMLRCVYRWENMQQPVQIILKEHEIPFTYMSAYDIENGRYSLKELKAKERKENIDIEKHPVTVNLYECPDKGLDFVLTWHHIVYDGWSNLLFLREIFSNYDHLAEAVPVDRIKKARYKEFIIWNKENECKQEKLWEEYFQDYTYQEYSLCNLNQEQGAEGEPGRCFIDFDESTCQKMKHYLYEKNMTAADFFYSVWSLLLYKYTGVSDFAIGVTTSGRTTEIENVNQTIGLFIHTLPLRIQIQDELKYTSLVQAVSESKRKLLGMEAGNLRKIKEYIGLGAQANLFSTLVVVENYPVELGKWLDAASKTEFHIESYDWIERNNYELVLGLLPPDSTRLLIQYAPSRYSEEYIDRMGTYLVQIVEEILSEPDISIKSISKYTLREQEKMATESENLETGLNFDIESFI